MCMKKKRTRGILLLRREVLAILGAVCLAALALWGVNSPPLWGFRHRA
jgi:hypothetical protein